MMPFFLKYAICMTLFLFSCELYAQRTTVKWSLDSCINYTLKNNSTIQSESINLKISKINLKDSRLKRLPDISVSNSSGVNLGRAIDVYTNLFTSGRYQYYRVGMGASVPVFQGFQIHNTIQQNKLLIVAETEKLKQRELEIKINTTSKFLEVLLSRERVVISKRKMNSSAGQLSRINKLSRKGYYLPVDTIKFKLQYINDSVQYLTDIVEHHRNLSNLKEALQINNDDFDIEPLNKKDIDRIVREATLLGEEDLDMENIAEKSHNALANKYLFQASEKNIAIAKGARYPQLILNYSLGANYSSTTLDQKFKENVINSTNNYIDINGNTYPVYSRNSTFYSTPVPFAEQLSRTLGQNLAISLSFPLTNWHTRISVQKARLMSRTQKILNFEQNIKFNQDIRNLLFDIKNNINNYWGLQQALIFSNESFKMAERKYELGGGSSIEYLSAHDELFNSENKLAIAKYNLLLKFMLIDYYIK